jgi:hypothetical protein
MTIMVLKLLRLKAINAKMKKEKTFMLMRQVIQLVCTRMDIGDKNIPMSIPIALDFG